jgi:hypothetical protein
MFSLFGNHLSRAWFILVIMTCLTMVTGHIGRFILLANFIFLVLAVAKSRLVLLDFLELRTRGRNWYAILMLWVAFVVVIVFAAAAVARS